MKLKYSSAPLLNYEWMDYNSLLEETQDGVFQYKYPNEVDIWVSTNRVILHGGYLLFEERDPLDKPLRRERLSTCGWIGRVFQRVNEPLPKSGTVYNSYGTQPSYTIP